MNNSIKTKTTVRGKVKIIKERRDPITGEMVKIEEVNLTNSLHPEAIKNRRDILQGKACDNGNYRYTNQGACGLGLSLKPSGELFDVTNRMDLAYNWGYNSSGQGSQVYKKEYDTIHAQLSPALGTFHLKLASPITVANKEELGGGTDNEILDNYLNENGNVSSFGLNYAPKEDGHSHTLKISTRINHQFTPISNLKEDAKIYGINLFNYTGFVDSPSSTEKEYMEKLELEGIRVIKGATPLTGVKLEEPLSITSEDYIRVIYDVIIVIEYFIELAANQGIYILGSSNTGSTLVRYRPLWKQLLKGEFVNLQTPNSSYVRLGEVLRLQDIPNSNSYTGEYRISFGKSPDIQMQSDYSNYNKEVISIDVAPKNNVYLRKYSTSDGTTNDVKKEYVGQYIANINPAYKPTVIDIASRNGEGFSGSHTFVFAASTKYEWSTSWIALERFATHPMLYNYSLITFDLFTKFPEPQEKTRYNKLEITVTHNKALEEMDFDNALMQDMSKEEEEYYEV